MTDKLRILFLCTGNSCRSQMGEGWTRHLKGDQIEVYSAGVEVHGMNPYAMQVMKEAGVNLSSHHSKLVAEVIDVELDYVITVCDHAHESCPLFTGNAKIIHHAFNDPPKLAAGLQDEEEILNIYRRVRDEIRDFVMTLPDSLQAKT